MKGKSPNQSQLSLVDQSLSMQLNPKHPLYRLARRSRGINLSRNLLRSIHIPAVKHILSV